MFDEQNLLDSHAEDDKNNGNSPIFNNEMERDAGQALSQR